MRTASAAAHAATHLTPAEQDALVRWRPGDTHGHVESLFVKLNLPEGRAVWLKLTLLRRVGARPDTVIEAWAIAFGLGPDGEHVALKSSWPVSEAHIERDCLYAKVGGVEWAQGRTAGALEDERTGQRVAWDLSYTTEHEGFRHLPAAWMYEGSVPKTKATSPQIDSRFEGWVEVAGRRVPVSGAPGMLGHNWGRQQAEFWTWAHCNAWEGCDGVVVEAVTSKVKFGPITSPLLTVVHARIPGERLDFNGFAQLVGTRSRPEGLSWSLRATAGDRRLEATFTAPPERFVGVNYHDPDGRIAHCLNTKIADGQVTILAKGGRGWEKILGAVSDRTSALEIGTRGDTFGVPIRIR